MKFDLVAEFATKAEMIAFHDATPADAYLKTPPNGGRNNRRIKKRFQAYREAVNDLEWQPNRLDLYWTNYVKDPSSLPD